MGVSQKHIKMEIAVRLTDETNPTKRAKQEGEGGLTRGRKKRPWV
jgi:hypothetical protein